MTEQEAYIEGFCKTAEARGIDPRQLIKSAQLFMQQQNTPYIFRGNGQEARAALDEAQNSSMGYVMGNDEDQLYPGFHSAWRDLPAADQMRLQPAMAPLQQQNLWRSSSIRAGDLAKTRQQMLNPNEQVQLNTAMLSPAGQNFYTAMTNSIDVAGAPFAKANKSSRVTPLQASGAIARGTNNFVNHPLMQGYYNQQKANWKAGKPVQ